MLTGFVKEGAFSSVMDAALASIPEEALINRSFADSDTRSMQLTGELDIKDVAIGLEVFAYGCVSGRRAGEVKQVCFNKLEVTVDSPAGAIRHTYDQLIQTTPVAQPGDSGGPVFTKGGKIIGLIVAGDALGTYILPFPFIKNTLSITL
jgi:streptogrisin D